MVFNTQEVSFDICKKKASHRDRYKQYFHCLVWNIKDMTFKQDNLLNLLVILHDETKVKQLNDKMTD